MTSTLKRDLLADVPEDVILAIFSQVDTARDMANLALTCRRLAHLLNERGWRIFVHARFPSTKVPRDHILPNPDLSWAMLAESLTWQTRCWDKRSLNFTATIHQSQNAENNNPGRPRHRPPTVCDVHYDLDSRSELLVWSEGPGICARRRAIIDQGWGETRTFARFDGGSDVVAGKDDIIGLSVVDHPLSGGLAVLAAHASGAVDLRSVEHESFGTLLTRFRPKPSPRSESSDTSADRVLGKILLLSMDVSRTGRIAVNDKENIFLYNLKLGRNNGEIPTESHPTLARNLFGSALPGTSALPDSPPAEPLIKDRINGSFLGGVKWIGGDGDILALGIQGQRHSALQYLQFKPCGKAFEINSAFDTAPYNCGSANRQLKASSITPLDVSSISNQTRPLILAAWSDGTCRLQDLRTATAFDSVYEDNVNPEANIEHILPWGTDRFVAAGSSDEVLRVFDLRWPRSYYHTTALPCRSVLPYPDPPQPFVGPKQRKALTGGERRACCDLVAGFECTWHRLSRNIYYRPNCNVYYRRNTEKSYRGPWGRTIPIGGVRSLAKGSDLAPQFFIGVSGGFLEARLGAKEKVHGSRVTADPNLSYEYLDLPGDVGSEDGEPSDGTGYQTMDVESFIMETGDGLAVAHNDRSIRLPPVRPNLRMRVDVNKIPQELVDSSRLDPRLQHTGDFGEFLTDTRGSYGHPVR